jgi:hypothetical protein
MEDCGDPTHLVSDQLWARYLRAGLDHRLTLSSVGAYPPVGTDVAPFEATLLPLLQGTGPTRLSGARLTSIELNNHGTASTFAQWIAYSKAHGFFDRLFYYPDDEPGGDPAAWMKFRSDAQALHAADPAARIIITSSIQDDQNGGALADTDILVPIIQDLDNRPGSGTYAGDQRPAYTDWLAGKSNRRLWSYQSCESDGCGACGDPSPGTDYTGWPARVIDSSAVQDRCFPWLGFRYSLSAELYWNTSYQLATAWDDNGQCAFSGSGDGTLFYPGKPSVIGGTTDIPVESIRLKLIREGMEDYEYLVQAAAINPQQAHAIADALFPQAYACAQSAADLETARNELFAMLDVPVAGGPDGGAGPAPQEGLFKTSALGCHAAGDRQAGMPWMILLALGLLLGRARR